MSGFFSLAIREASHRISEWWSQKEEVERDGPLSESNPIWLNDMKQKYAAWIIEGAYLRYKRVLKDKKEIEQLHQRFNHILVFNISKYSRVM